jgi:hypothetical protein
MSSALLAGERDPDVHADLARGTLRKKVSQLREALFGLATRMVDVRAFR